MTRALDRCGWRVRRRRFGLEIAPGVHAVPLRAAQGHLLWEDRLTLIDTGLPGSRPRLERYLATQGRSIDELDRIICTHGHPDHAGGVRELAPEGVEVLMHPADFAGLQLGLRAALLRPSRGRLFAAMTRAPVKVTPIEDGDVLPMLGGLHVVHTPGHTPGSVCLYAPRDRLLFVGDALELRRGRMWFASPWFSDDIRAARLSVRRLAELDVETLVFSHWPPWRADANGALRELAAKVAVM